MKRKFDTPTGLEPESDGVHEWVRFQLLKIHERVRTIEESVDNICNKQEKVDDFIMKTEVRLAEGTKTFQTLDEQIRELRTIQKNGKKYSNNGKVTFQWLVEKLGTPVITSIITAIIITALIFWVTGTP